jgi:hypothetical protein
MTRAAAQHRLAALDLMMRNVGPKIMAILTSFVECISELRATKKFTDSQALERRYADSILA